MKALIIFLSLFIAIPLFAQTVYPPEVVSFKTAPSLQAFKRLRSAQIFRRYKLQRTGRHKLLNGSYNNRYETQHFKDFVMEVQTLGGKVLGIDVIFYERNHLTSKELTFLWRLIQSLPAGQKLDDPTKDAIVNAAETDGPSQSDVEPVDFNKLTIHARRDWSRSDRNCY